jgi:hypothetical protein
MILPWEAAQNTQKKRQKHQTQPPVGPPANANHQMKAPFSTPAGVEKSGGMSGGKYKPDRK